MSYESPLRCPLCNGLIPLVASASCACNTCGAALTVTVQPALPPAGVFGVRLLDPGLNKIMVIKAVRQLTNLGLAEAKNIVEGPMPIELRAADEKSYRLALKDFAVSYAKYEELNGDTQTASAPFRETATATASANEHATLVMLLDSGPNKIAVIKEIREVTGLGLREAKDLCDSAPTRFQVVQGHTAAALRQRFASVGARVDVR